MTTPLHPDSEFEFRGAEPPQPPESVDVDRTGAEKPAETTQRPDFPPSILDVSQEQKDKLLIWLDQWIRDLESAQSDKMTDWAAQEDDYRALTPGALEFEPFKGACRDVIPVGAMAVDPIHARLSIGIFKQDPVFTFKALKKEYASEINSVEKFVEFYQKHYLKLRKVSSPRLLEECKLGTCVFKTVYDVDEYPVLKYDAAFKPIKGKEIRFRGPRVFGVSLGDLLFPPNYEDLQDCPIVAERQRTTYEKLKVREAAGKLANVDAVKNQQTIGIRTDLESARERAGRHALRTTFANEVTVYEAWCDYDINGDGLPEHLVITYHKDNRAILQLRYNWYFHQRKPYTLIPYTTTNDSLYGLGILEMTKPFQDAITRLHRLASDNAYLANVRMFIVRRNSGIEKVPRLYTGRCFFVDEPSKDFIPFAVSDIYPSTLAERQNLFGMLEKRTGVSDYLTGRESPVIGTRATATSTLALIQEAKARVEEVLQNIRDGYEEIVQNCISIWIQFGTGGVEDLIFGGDQVAQDVKKFFNSVTQENVNGLFAVGLTVTEAATSKQAQQQMQLALIQIMMQYLEKVLQAGEAALMAMKQGLPEYTEMVKEVMKAARAMFLDLTKKYDVANPEDYIPDLEKYLENAGQGGQPPVGPGGGNGATGQPGGATDASGVPLGRGPFRGPAVPNPATPGGGAGSGPAAAVAGAG